MKSWRVKSCFGAMYSSRYSRLAMSTASCTVRSWVRLIWSKCSPYCSWTIRLEIRCKMATITLSWSITSKLFYWVIATRIQSFFSRCANTCRVTLAWAVKVWHPRWLTLFYRTWGIQWASNRLQRRLISRGVVSNMIKTQRFSLSDSSAVTPSIRMRNETIAIYRTQGHHLVTPMSITSYVRRSLPSPKRNKNLSRNSSTKRACRKTSGETLNSLDLNRIAVLIKTYRASTFSPKSTLAMLTKVLRTTWHRMNRPSRLISTSLPMIAHFHFSRWVCKMMLQQPKISRPTNRCRIITVTGRSNQM